MTSDFTEDEDVQRNDRVRKAIGLRSTFAAIFTAVWISRFASVFAASGDEQWDRNFFVSGFGSSSSYAMALAQDVQGRLIVGGNFSGAGGTAGSFGLGGNTTGKGRIACWDGSNWISLGGGITSPISAAVNSIAVRGGDVFIGGSFTNVGGVAATNLARWDGTNWWPVGGGVTGGSCICAGDPR